MTADRELSFGEKAVGMTFDPGGHYAVTACKAAFAHAINQMNDLRNDSDNAEIFRMASIAITEAQTAQMWAVKALTWKSE